VSLGLSINEAAGIVDSRSCDACWPVWEVGGDRSSPNDLLVVGVHFPNGIPNSCTSDVCQNEHGTASWLLPT